MHSSREFDQRRLLHDVRAGVSESQLMEKYGLSVGQFSSLLVQALKMGILKESEIRPTDDCWRSANQLEDLRRSRRKKVDCSLLVRKVNQRTHGAVSDVCEEGLQVVGLPAERGDRACLEIFTDWCANGPAVVVDAVCRWSNGAVARGNTNAGYQLIRVIQGDLRGLLEDLSPLSLACTGLADSKHLPDADEDDCDLASTGTGRILQGWAGVQMESGISRLRFFGFLDTLPIPCLLVDQAGRIIYVNQYSSLFSEAMFTLKGNQFSAMFGEEAAIWKERASARIPGSAKAWVEATLKIEGNTLPCRIQFNFLDSNRGLLCLVFFWPATGPTGGESLYNLGADSASPLPLAWVRSVSNDSRALIGTRCRTADVAETECNDGLECSREALQSSGDGSVASDGRPQSKVISDVLEVCRLAAKSNGIVLLQGESGSGKDYLARFIHNHSSRSEASFRSVNCAAIPEHLAESEFFGHEEGAFTGAHARKKGILELAPGGTLLLNEIGELPLALQTKLLTFLDSGRFFRVGGLSEVSIDSRILAATNQDLREAVRRGSFRADLFFRLNVFPVKIPALRERVEDLSRLIEELTADLAQRLRLSTVPVVTNKTLAVLQNYHWPGNVRELQNRLERSLTLSRGQRISLPLMFGTNSQDQWTFNLHFPKGSDLNGFKKEATRRLITEALVRAGGKRQVAARLLGITRYSLKRHMTSLGLMENENG